MNQQDIEQAINALGTQRNVLGNTVVNTAIEALQHCLDQPGHDEISTSALRGERRQVTVMFADISGFTAMSEKLDPEEVRGIINACFEQLGTAIDRYAGHIDKFIGDEIMALFGAPIAHENDPERALRAALDMMSTLAEFNRQYADRLPQPLALHFGINSGLVIAGGIGTNQRQDYSVMGDTVNLAARLEDLSETGEILVGEDTYRLTAPLFEFEALTPVRLKGKAQPVQVYKLLRAKTVVGGQIRGIKGLYSPLVGRVNEMSTLRSALESFYQNHGSVISVIGDAGLGKSRIINELRAECAHQGNARWCDGRALSHADNASYLVARDTLRDMLGMNFETSSAEAASILRAEITRCMPNRITDVYPYLAQLLEAQLDKADEQRIKYLDGQALHQRILQSVQDFIVAKSQQQPLAMVWEDLHWADPSSLELLESLLPITQEHPLLLLLIYRRPIQGSKIWHFHKNLCDAQIDYHTTMDLPPLNNQESGQLLDNLLGQNALPENIRTLMITKAEGNPFYLEEVIRSLIDGGAITRREDNDGWVAAPGLEEIKLPDSLQGVIMARIDQLNPQTKQVLQVASIIGRNFSQDVLTRVMERVG